MFLGVTVMYARRVRLDKRSWGLGIEWVRDWLDVKAGGGEESKRCSAYASGEAASEDQNSRTAIETTVALQRALAG